MSEENCVFCKISKGETKADFVYQDDEIIAFNDISPKAPVHLLLVPRRHIESINHLCNDDAELMGSMMCIAPKIAKEVGTGDGYKLLFNVGRKGGQIVDHIHLHLMGGW